MKNKFLLFLLFALPAFAFGQVLKTAAVPYTKGASPFTPNTASSSEIRVDTSCSCMYWWDRDNLTWMRMRTGADVISGSAAPSYTPHDNQSLFAVNADSELYYYNGSAWVQIGGSGGGGIYGGSGNVPDGTIATLVDDFEFSGPDISSYTVTTGTSTGGQYFQNFSGATLTHRDTSGSSSLAMSGTGALFSFGDGATDRLTIGNRDARYSGDYSGTYSARSLIDKGYADATYLSDADLSGSADEVAVFSGTNSVTSYPEMAFDGSTLNLGADLNTLKTTPTWSLVDSDASNTGGGGTLVIGNFDGTAIGSGHRLGVMQFMGSTGVSGTAIGASIESYAGATWSGTSSPGGLNFLTTPSGSLTPRNRLELTRNGEARLRTGTDLLFYSTTDASTAGMAISGDSSLLIYGTKAGAEAETVIQTKIGLLRSGSVTLNADVNNLYMGCGGGIVEIAANGSYKITGIQPNMLAGASRLLFAKNASSYVLTLVNESASSSANNRFSISSDFFWPPGETIMFLWNDGANRWTIPNKTLSESPKLRRTITGTAATELFLDGASMTAAIPLGEKWIVEVACLAEISVVGDGTGGLALDDTFAATYRCVIANKAGTTALVGTVQADMAAQSDATMTDAVFTITADNTGDYLKVTYTGGANTGSSTQTNAYANLRVFKY